MISAVTVGFAAGFFVASVGSSGGFLIPGVLIGAVALGCYLRAPVAYHASRGLDGLVSRRPKKLWQNSEHISGSGALGFYAAPLGNGGLFAGTGIFWNRQWGLFRACNHIQSSTLVLVETATSKVLISPAHAEELLASYPEHGMRTNNTSDIQIA